MSLEAIALNAGKAVIPIIVKELVPKIKTALNPTDLEKALKAGIDAANEIDAAQPLSRRLFYKCGDKEARDVLEKFFKNSGVQAELQKPLEDKGKPDIAFLVVAFKQVGAELKRDFPENSIEFWLKQFTDTYFEKTSTFLKFQLAKEDYFKQLVNYFDDVKFAGIAVAGQEIDKSARLEQIFVMPDVVEEAKNIENSLINQKFILTDETGDTITDENGNFIVGTHLLERQQELLQKQHQRAQLARNSARKILAAQLLNQNQTNSFVLLGNPGSGKTTLLSYFAVMLAQKQPQELGLSIDTHWLPILIRIRDLSRYHTLSIVEYVKQFAYNNLTVKKLPSGFFEYWLEDGRALILLDGLDEVAEEGKRYEIVNKIECFLGQFSQNKAIITSRPAGYRRDFFKTEEFPHYSLELFDDSKIDIFIKNWYESRLQDPEERQRRQESLKQALATQDRIKILARNPLLLTIIALIHRYEADLPKRRHKLYERAVKTLIVNWDKGKELNHSLLKYLDLDDIQRLMEQLAYWIHEHGDAGDKEGGTLIDREELITQLSKFIVEQKTIERHQAKAEAERFVEHIRDRAGLLNEQGQDCYAFVHKTFQEYLAAQEIRDRQEGDGDEVVSEHIQKYLHHPHWREVILLLIAQQHKKKLPKFLKEILSQHTSYESWLHRNLFFATSCLAENVEVADEGLVSEILDQLVKLEISNSKQVGDKIREQVFKTLCSLSETRFEAQALQLLKTSADSIDEMRLLEYRTALGEKQEAIAILLSQLEARDRWVRRNAVEALGKLGNASPEVVTALLSRLADEYDFLRFFAVETLGKLGNQAPEVINAFLSQLADEDNSVRGNAAWALGNFGNTSAEVVSALLSRLADENDWVRGNAAYALGRLGNVSSKVVSALLSRLADENDWVRRNAAEAIGNLGNASAEVVSALLSLLADEDNSVRGNAVWALGNLGNDSAEVVSALLSLLADEDKNVRRYVAWALGNLGNTSLEVVSALLSLLVDEDDWVRQYAAWALGNLGNDSAEVVSALLSRLADENDWERGNAAWALGALGNASPEVVSALLSLLLPKPDNGVRQYAAWALGKLGNTSSDVIPAVTQWIDRHHDSKFVGYGIDALWNLVVGEN